MAIETITTSVKPEGVSFFNEAHTENLAETQSEYDWISSLPGFVSFKLEVPDANTTVRTLVWDTLENYANFLKERGDRPSFNARNEYNALNGITYTLAENIV